MAIPVPVRELELAGGRRCDSDTEIEQLWGTHSSGARSASRT